MKNKGFTLIELLAVILILGIIALIAIPTVTNIIEEARRGAFETSVKEILKLADEQFAIEVMKDGSVSNKNFDFNNDKGGLDYKGSDFTSGTVEVDNDGSIAVNITDGRYCANGPSSNLVITTENCDNPPTPFTSGMPVYFNPETGTKCKEAEAIVMPGSNNGCLKWYTLEKTGNDVDIILAHNISENVVWSSDVYSNVPVEAQEQLEIDTQTWKSTLNPRLPDANMIARVVGADTALNWKHDEVTWGDWFYFEGAVNGTWNMYVSGQGTSSYAWLFDYLYGCTSYGCNHNGNIAGTPGSPSSGGWSVSGSGYGYWTNNPVNYDASVVNLAWYIERDGGMSRISRNIAGAGIRPVITVNSNILK